MERLAAVWVQGIQLAMAAVGVTTGIVAIKAKNRPAVEAVEAACHGTAVRVHLLGDPDPAGNDCDPSIPTGRLIPATGRPIQVGAGFCNVATFVNSVAAVAGRVVTHTTLTIAGAVQEPETLPVPTGTSLSERLAAVGGRRSRSVMVCRRILMGETTENLDRPVTKTTGGGRGRSRQHRVIGRKLKPPPISHAIGQSACDQSRSCTEYSPRDLLGYAVERHRVMRSVALTTTEALHWNE
jgi:Na+-translocating ferredoxin:NAD+ oxidoreductase RnfC subunit